MNGFNRRDRRGAPWPRRLAAGLCTLAMATQVACYTYQPLQEVAPVNGHEVALELNDRGRSLVGGQLGESVLQVQGRMLGSTDSAVTLSVARTVLMQGAYVTWTGEQVVIPKEGVRGFRPRQYSKGRTMMLTVATVLGVALLGSVISLVAGGNGRPDGGGTCTTGCNGQ